MKCGGTSRFRSPSRSEPPQPRALAAGVALHRLQAAPGCSGMSWRRLRQYGSVRHVGAGTLLVAAGTPIRHVQVVAGGELQLCARVDGRRVTALLVRPGGVICDIPLLLEAPMPYDALATQDTEIISLTCDRWLSMLTLHQDLCLRWMLSIARRLDDDRRAWSSSRPARCRRRSRTCCWRWESLVTTPGPRSV